MAEQKTKWQRARSPEQVAERRADILQAAGDLIDESGLDAAGLNAIARRVGLSKPNLYRYFESREAILLQLALDAFCAWSDRVGQELGGSADRTDQQTIESIARILARTCARQPRLGLLMNALPGIIEHNISLETAIEFKAKAFGLFQQTAGQLAGVLPGLSELNAANFLWLWSIAACGAWPHCHPNPIIEQAMKHLGMDAMLQPYEETIYALAVPLLRDAINQG